MSEVSRPPIDLGLMHDITQEEELAQEVFSLLNADANEVDGRIDDCMFSTLQTEPIDLLTKEGDCVSLRVKSVPVLLIDNGGEPKTHLDASNYYVIDVEHRPTPDEYDFSDDFQGQHEVKWTKYLRVVINTVSTDDVTVLDGQSYEKLDSEELIFALFLLRAMRHEQRDAQYDEHLRGTAEAQARLVQKLLHGKFGLFDSTDFLQVSACDHGDCQSLNEPCEHNPYTLN